VFSADPGIRRVLVWPDLERVVAMDRLTVVVGNQKHDMGDLVPRRAGQQRNRVGDGLISDELGVPFDQLSAFVSVDTISARFGADELQGCWQV